MLMILVLVPNLSINAICQAKYVLLGLVYCCLANIGG